MEGNATAHSIIGRQIGRYQIVERLGAGGMGVVYKALDLTLGRSVALKFLPPQLCYDERLKERFLQEGKAASALDHNNIGVIHGIEESDDGQMFIVMACYDGVTLSAKVQQGPLPVGQAVDFATQIAKGLSSAHAREIIHRDIKPSNILITSQGVAKIVDFGLARLAGGAGLTQPGSTLGTAAYMSPEQAQGNPVDQRTDIWSLGVVLYEMLTGTLPFGGPSIHSVLHGVISKPAPDLPEQIPPSLNAVVQRALSKDIAKRYAAASEMERDLLAAAQPLSADERTQTVIIGAHQAPVKRPGRRNAVLLFCLALLLLASAVFLSPAVRHKAAGWMAGGSPAARRLVVLPFSNIGDDPANGALLDGLVEVLTSKLTGLERLQSSLSVVPASEVRRRKVTSPSEARKEFKADLAVTGSVQRNTGGVTLNIALVDAAGAKQIDAAAFHEPTGALLSVQDDAFAKLAQMLDVQGKPEAIQAIAKAGSAVPAAYETYLQGVGLLQRYDKPGNLDGAIALFQQTVDHDPKFALAYAKLGEAYQRKYRVSKDPMLLRHSQDNSSRALGLNDQLPTPYVTLGLLHDGTGHHDLAVQEFERALRLDERNADAYQGLARAFESLGRTKEAEAMFQKAVDLDPEFWEGYSRLGAFYSRQGRYDEAVAQFRHLVQVAPDNSLGYINLGASLFRLGKSKDAAEMYRKSLELTPSYIAYSNLGGVYYRDRQYAQAAGMYENALKLNDKDYRIWRNLALSYKKLNGMNPKTRGTYERANQAALRFLESNSQDADAMAELADIKINLGQKQEAERLARRAAALAPQDPAVLLKAADIYESLGARDQALNWLAAALKRGIPKENVMRDTDLEQLRSDPRFAAIVAGTQQRP